MQPFKTVLGALSLCTLGGILVAGLWPFHAPENEVSWNAHGNGLRFGDYGVLLSSGLFNPPPHSSASLEVWMEPGREKDTNTFLAFYTPANPLRFSLHQSYTDLELIRAAAPQKPQRLYVDGIFAHKKPLLITITSGPRATKVYIDAVLARTSTLPLTGEDLQGLLVLGTSPIVNDAWSGFLKGLAIYQTELAPAQVSQNCSSWIRNGTPDVRYRDLASAVYLFNERRGSIVHNRVGSGPDLRIPVQYTMVRERMFTPFWREVFPGWGFWWNCLINIGGFVPFGFLVHAYLTAARSRRPLAFAILAGFAVSFLIELFQGYLPSRQSGTMDLITNTSGAAIGAIISNHRFVRTLFQRLDLIPATSSLNTGSAR